MEIDEVAARVARRYWPLLLILTMLPALYVQLTLSGESPRHTATARLNTNSDATEAVGGDAGVSVIVSQVKALATSQDLLSSVIRAQRVDRRPSDVARNVEVTGLGTSAIVELALSDRAPEVARRLSNAVTERVVQQLNQARTGALNAQIADVGTQIESVSERLTEATEEVRDKPLSISAGAAKERLQSELSDLQADRRELRTQLAAIDEAKIVQQALLQPQTDSGAMRVIIAALVGLIVAILISVLAETFRPTVPGPHRVARRLGVPLLGSADQGPARLADTGRRIRLAAKREGVTQVALVSTGRGAVPADVVSRLAAAVYGDSSMVIKPAPLTVAGLPDSDSPSPESPGSPGSPDDAGQAGQSNGDGTNSRTPATPSTAIIRTGAALMTKRSQRAEAVAAQVAARAVCHVHAFEDIDPGADTDGVGVVAVAGPVTELSALQSVRDLVTASGWPLLGVVAVSRKIGGKRG